MCDCEMVEDLTGVGAWGREDLLFDPKKSRSYLSTVSLTASALR